MVRRLYNPRAIFMEFGGAFDNAKKYIEGGHIAGQGKGSPAHKLRLQAIRSAIPAKMSLVLH